MADVYLSFVVFKNFSVRKKASCVLFVSAGVVREFDVIFMSVDDLVVFFFLCLFLYRHGYEEI